MNMASSKFGREIGLMHELLITGRRVGAEREFWAILAHDAQLLGRVVEFVYEPACYDVVVDYSRPLLEVIRAGNYIRVASSIRDDSFPSVDLSSAPSGLSAGGGKRRIRVALFRLRRNTTSDECVAEMDKHGYRPGGIEELLALGGRYPDLRNSSIVALGPAEHWGWRYPVATAEGSQGTRFLLDYRNFVDQYESKKWPVSFDFRFLAVCKDA